MANPLSVTLHASGAETVTGQGASVDMGSPRNALRELLLSVTAWTGTSLTVNVQTSPSSTGPWTPAGAFPIVQGTIYKRQTFGGLERYVRAAWEFVGTTVTFALSGEAHVSYADPVDLPFLAILEQAIEDLTDEHKAKSLLSTTGLADSYLSGQYTLPLVSWGDELRRCVGHITAYDLMVTRGFNPDDHDEEIRLRYKDALEWLKMIRDGKLSPPDIIDTTPTVNEAGSFMVTDAKRGW